MKYFDLYDENLDAWANTLIVGEWAEIKAVYKAMCRNGWKNELAPKDCKWEGWKFDVRKRHPTAAIGIVIDGKDFELMSSDHIMWLMLQGDVR